MGSLSKSEEERIARLQTEVRDLSERQKGAKSDQVAAEMTRELEQMKAVLLFAEKVYRFLTSLDG